MSGNVSIPMQQYLELMAMLGRVCGKDTKPKIKTADGKMTITIPTTDSEALSAKLTEELKRLPVSVTSQIVLITTEGAE